MNIDDLKERFEERAAIMQYDGKMEYEQACFHAYYDVYRKPPTNKMVEGWREKSHLQLLKSVATQSQQHEPV